MEEQKKRMIISNDAFEKAYLLAEVQDDGEGH